MYLHLGNSFVVPRRYIIGIFDMDTATWSYKTRECIDAAQKQGRIIDATDDLPRSFVVCGSEQEEPIIYLSHITASTLLRRLEQNRLE